MNSLSPLQSAPASDLQRILCIGGGPAGLYFALLMKARNPALQITVVERNRPFDTFGWGVVLSDQTLGNLKAADAETAALIGNEFHHWDDIQVFFKGRQVRSGGHGFCGIGRKRLLNILQERCLALGVDLVFETDATDDQAIAAQYRADLVIASDGLNSRIRQRYADVFKPDVDLRNCRFVWLGTHQTFDAFTFAFEQTEHGWFQAHAYQFDDKTSTFIVETPEAVWQAHGLDQMEQPEAVAFCEKLFAKYLGGHSLISNATHLRGSANWIRFPRVVCERWTHRIDVEGRSVPVVLMGDAAHTAHFSIGSGTKLALEDAIDLANEFAQGGTVDHVLEGYEARRSVEVLKIQNAARNSTEWFENVPRYTGMQIEQFAYSLLTRSQRISHENLRVRDTQWLGGYEQWLAGGKAMAPMLMPYKVRGLTLKNRILVSPMATYSAVDGVPQDFLLVHLGARALGGAAMVFVEMTSPTPEGRITPACTGLYNDTQQAAFKRIVDFVHSQSSAKIAMQLGHSGPKGSTRVGWEGTDEPLEDGNWPVLGASALPYGEQNQLPAAITRAEMDTLRDQFVDSTRRAVECGFDWLELHCAHGYLLSAFISPLTNQRTDEYGGDIEARCRYPLEVFRAMRAVWPGQADERAHLRARLGARRQHRCGCGHRRAPLQGSRRRFHRRVFGPDHARRQAGLRPHVPDAVLRPHPQRGRHRDHRGGRDHRCGPGQQHHRRGSRRPLRHRTPAPGGPRLDAARSRQAAKPRCRLAQAVPERPRPDVPRDRQAAADGRGRERCGGGAEPRGDALTWTSKRARTANTPKPCGSGCGC
jgi:anthraniloyl-CoA monooxygenase